jgi:lipoprotein signal peptidase
LAISWSWLAGNCCLSQPRLHQAEPGHIKMNLSLDDFINWSLLKEPYNWIVVILILVLVYLTIMFIQKPLSQLNLGTLTTI